VYVRDRGAGTTTLVSTDSDGNQGNGSSGRLFNAAPTALSVGDDGDVAFVSWASNLVAGDTNGQSDAFVHDWQTGDTTRVSLSETGAQLSVPSTSGLSMSRDSRAVAFVTQGAVISGVTGYQTYIHDRETGTTTLGSAASGGAPSNAGTSSPTLSGDGRYLAFVTAATNLSNETGSTARPDVFVRDRTG
jgi:hypothetical protein